MILLSHLHVDHSADLPYLVKASFLTGRGHDLSIDGPTGNRRLPSTPDFLRSLFGHQGAYQYLNDFLEGDGPYQILPREIDATARKRQDVLETAQYTVSTVAVHHGPIPALAWRIDVQDKAIVFSGDMNNDYQTLAGLAAGAGLLLAHHAIPEEATGVARELHMPPSVMGEIAGQAQVKQLVLSHCMKRARGKEAETTRLIATHYPGPVDFVDDLDCFAP